MIRLAMVLTSAILCGGCAGLLVYDQDPFYSATAKTVTRTIICVSTLGMSELAFADLRDEDAARRDLWDYRAHLTSRVNAKAMTQLEAEQLWKRRAAMVTSRLVELSERRERRLRLLRTYGLLIAATTGVGMLVYPAYVAVIGDQ